MSIFTVAKYLRISSEDDDLKEAGKRESNSIANQRDLLDSFIAGTPDFSGAAVVEFCDDGWSGKDFERPAFQKMLTGARQGKIQCIVVKDMSRFGRDYLVVGNYISKVFPFLGVRFIAVNDGVDSIRPNDTDSLDTSFKALIYDLYSRDLSRKVRSAKNFRAQKGDFLAPFAPFGYVKNPENRKQLVADPAAAGIVRQIFQMAADGMKTVQIAKALNREGIPTPMVYKRMAGCSRSVWPCVREDNFWTHRKVSLILRDERYLGKSIYGKHVRDIVGNQHLVKCRRDDWMTVEGTHEGIVAQEEFDRAQDAMRKFSERGCYAAGNNPLCGKVRCGICGYAMNRSDGKNACYGCRTSLVTERYLCPDEKISERELLEFVLEGLCVRAAAAEELSDVWAEQQRQARKDRDIQEKRLLSLREALVRQANQTRGIYESFVLGEIDKEKYLSAKAAASKQKEGIIRQIAEMEAALEQNNSDIESEDKVAFGFREYERIRRITQEIATAVLKEVRVYPGNRLEMIWNYRRDFSE